MKRIFVTILGSFFLLNVVSSFASASNPQQEYIEKYASTAVSEMKRTGVPASITLAQGILESGSGRSELAVKANNHFGIKCHNDWTGKKTYHDDDFKNECFRVYPDAAGSFRDHSDFLRYKDRYKFLFNLDSRDYKSWARGLKAAGYATDPAYADKLIKYIEDYKLYRYDSGVEVEEPAPLIAETAVAVDKPLPNPVRNYNERVSIPLSSPRMEQNGVMFVIAAEGDSYESIAARYDLFKKEIRRFNDAGPDDVLSPGDVVYIEHKKPKAAKGLNKYVVGGSGETLRGICQRFAVREASVRRMNKFPKDYKPAEGDVIRLR